eukprot:4437007-Pyramimonas_sp.AAC.1
MMLRRRLSIPVSLEYPRSSMVWRTPQLLRVPNLPDSHIIYIDFCIFGKPWMKRTRILSMSVRHDHATPRCSSRHGFCDRANKPHEILEGRRAG